MKSEANARNRSRTPVSRQGVEGEWVTGTISKNCGSMGFCSVPGYEGDVLLGANSLREAGVDLRNMQVGESLTFQISMGAKGYHAQNIQPASGHGYGQASQRVFGTIKKIHGGNGFCSVEGVEGDVLLGFNSLKEAGISMMNLGDTLSFEMEMGPKGYHAINIQQAMRKPMMSMRSPVMSMRSPMMGMQKMGMQNMGMQNMGMQMMGMQSRVVGMLKRVHGGNGFCSVEGVEGDVLLGSRSLNESGVNLENMQLGEYLTFEMAMGPKGYSATNIRNASTAHAMPTAAKGAHGGNGSWFSGSMGQRVLGTIKRINGGNAFCSVEGVPKDVLLGSRSLGESGINIEAIQVGEQFTFELIMGPKGYNAANIQQGSRYVGTLKRISGANGFCSVDGVAGDVLLGSRSLGESGIDLATMKVGDMLSFDMESGPKGHHATNISQVS